MSGTDLAALGLTFVLAVIAAIGATVRVATAIRSAARTPAKPAAKQGLVRLEGVVQTGWEQTLIGLVRELGLPRSPSTLSYGQLYIEPQSERQIFIRSRSEIGRGFIGSLDLAPGTRTTPLTYAILRLPADDDIHRRALDLELDLISALRRIDPEVEVRLTGGALHPVDQTQHVAFPVD